MSKILLGLLFGCGIIGYFYYNDTQRELTELRELNMAMELQVATQNDTIDKMQNLLEQRQRLLPAVNRYYGFFGKLADKEHLALQGKYNV